jgi:hypothetical protein
MPDSRESGDEIQGLLNHFSQSTCATIGSEALQEALQTIIASPEALQPHLLNIILALSAAHLKVSSSGGEVDIYENLESLYWDTALSQYLDRLRRADTSDIEATIATCILTVIYTFSMEADIPRDAYMTSDPERLQTLLNPLAVAGGFRAIKTVVGDFLHDSCWRDLLQSTDDADGTFSSDATGVHGLAPAFVELCELDQSSNPDNNPYHAVVRLLSPLLRLTPTSDDFGKLIAFSGRAWPHLQPLVAQMDDRCLLLLAYWFALMARLDQWWITPRAQGECSAVVAHLGQLNDERFDALLLFPASFGHAGLQAVWKSSARPLRSR